jgi:hypothetical protein
VREPFRVQPKLPVGAMKTYGIVAPPATHWRPASCDEVDCPNYLSGWITVLDEVAQAELVAAVRTSGRKPAAVRREGGRITFTFEAGTPCFKASQHKVRLDRQEHYVVFPGDWRGAAGPTRRHQRPQDWVEDFAEHQDRLNSRLGRG